MWGWQVASTTVSLILAALTLWIVLVNRKQVEASQEQVRVSREQVTATQAQVKVSQDQIQQALEVQYDSQRPLIVPDGVLPIVQATDSLPVGHQDQHPWLDFGPSECSVILTNVGTGIALNVWGIIMGPESAYIANDYPQRYTLNVTPVLHCGPREVVKAPKAGPTVWGKAMIGDYQLYAPQAPPVADGLNGDYTRNARPCNVLCRYSHRLNKGASVVVARLTLTYHDVFGHKHATIFNYMAWGQWRYVAFLRNITEDIEDRHVEAIGQGVFEQ